MYIDSKLLPADIVTDRQDNVDGPGEEISEGVVDNQISL
jgi:hypothetical protein